MSHKSFILTLALIGAFVAGSSSFASDLTSCTPEGSPCDDGIACTLNDTCVGGVCKGSLPPPIRYCSVFPGALSIPGGPGPATPYPSSVSVAAGPTICKVTAYIEGIVHTNPDDIDMLLQGPAGQNAKIWSDVGGSQDVNGPSITLDDAASLPIPDGGPLFAEGKGAPFGGGTYRPTDVNDGPDSFPAPAPVPSGGSAFSVFNGTNPNGAWKLWVVDDKALDSGSISRWCLRISFLCTSNAQCDDSDACTIDTCEKGACVHVAPEPEPPEVLGLHIAANKQTLGWTAEPIAITYDVVRGAIASLPLGPGGGDETCLGNNAGTSLTDATAPATGTGLWYLVRGSNCYGQGIYGTQSNGFPQLTSTCP